MRGFILSLMLVVVYSSPLHAEESVVKDVVVVENLAPVAESVAEVDSLGDIENLSAAEVKAFIAAERAKNTVQTEAEFQRSAAAIAASKARAEAKKREEAYFLELRAATKKQASEGEPTGMYYYARFLDMDKKYKEADEWMKKAADSGNEDAKIYRAALVPGFAFGMYNKVRDNREVAYKQLTIAAQDGHLNAQFHLGVMFDEDGDSLTAIEWYKKAAAAGHPAAQAVLDMTEKYE